MGAMPPPPSGSKVGATGMDTIAIYLQNIYLEQKNLVCTRIKFCHPLEKSCLRPCLSGTEDGSMQKAIMIFLIFPIKNLKIKKCLYLHAIHSVVPGEVVAF